MGLKRYFIARDGMECFAKIERLYGALQYAINGDSGFTILDEELIKREKIYVVTCFRLLLIPMAIGGILTWFVRNLLCKLLS